MSDNPPGRFAYAKGHIGEIGKGESPVAVPPSAVKSQLAQVAVHSVSHVLHNWSYNLGRAKKYDLIPICVYNTICILRCIFARAWGLQMFNL